MLRGAGAGLLSRDGFLARADDTFLQTKDDELQSAVFQIEIDDFEDFVDQYGQDASEKVIATLADRVVSVMLVRRVSRRGFLLGKGKAILFAP